MTDKPTSYEYSDYYLEYMYILVNKSHNIKTGVIRLL